MIDLESVELMQPSFQTCLVCGVSISYHSLYERRGGSSARCRNHSDSRSILSEPTHHEESSHSSYRQKEKT